MNNRAIILTFGVAAIMLVIGAAISSVAFPMTRTETITQRTTISSTPTSAITAQSTVASSKSMVGYVANLLEYYPIGYYGKNISVASLKDGENITYDQVIFQFRLLPTNLADI